METHISLERLFIIKKRVEKLIEQKQSVKSFEVQSLNYFIFEDSLEAAGIANALNEDPNEIKLYLRQAAQAALEVYRFKSTTIGKIGYLPSLKEDDFIDDSMTNSWTHIQAIYSSAASESWKELKEIASIPTELNESKQIDTLPIVSQFLDLLLLLVKKSHSISQIQELIIRYKASEDEDEIYWYIQVESIGYIIKNNEVEFETSMEKLTEFIVKYYTKQQLENHYNYLLLLPVLGLRSLKKFFSILY